LAEPENPPDVRELQAAGDPHLRRRPRRGAQLRQLPLGAAGRRDPLLPHPVRAYATEPEALQPAASHHPRGLAPGGKPASLYFLDGRLADAAIEANRKTKTIETFLAGEGEEIEIAVKNVAIDDLREPPYRATVDFEKVYYTQHDHLEIRRERYVAHFVFVVKERVPNAMIPINPLGLTITYFREDQAFQ
jgi:hypothetical protein